jgi:hypothetical protein
MHVPKKLRDIINKEMNDILKSFEGYNSRMVLFIKVRIKTDKYLVIQQQVCKVYVEPEQVRQCRQSIYNLESGRDGTTRIVTL